MLSPLEKSCLRWVAAGRTSTEIAALEGRALGEIDDCLARVVKSLGARSLEDALARTLRDQDLKS